MFSEWYKGRLVVWFPSARPFVSRGENCVFLNGRFLSNLGRLPPVPPFLTSSRFWRLPLQFSEVLNMHMKRSVQQWHSIVFFRGMGSSVQQWHSTSVIVALKIWQYSRICVFEFETWYSCITWHMYHEYNRNKISGIVITICGHRQCERRHRRRSGRRCFTRWSRLTACFAILSSIRNW